MPNSGMRGEQAGRHHGHVAADPGGRRGIAANQAVGEEQQHDHCRQHQPRHAQQRRPRSAATARAGQRQHRHRHADREQRDDGGARARQPQRQRDCHRGKRRGHARGARSDQCRAHREAQQHREVRSGGIDVAVFDVDARCLCDPGQPAPAFSGSDGRHDQPQHVQGCRAGRACDHHAYQPHQAVAVVLDDRHHRCQQRDAFQEQRRECQRSQFGSMAK